MRTLVFLPFLLLAACGIVDDDVSRVERIEAEATTEAVADDVTTDANAEIIADCVVENATEGEVRTLAALNDVDPAIAAEQRVADVITRDDTVECITDTRAIQPD